jgi:TonB family protein
MSVALLASFLAHGNARAQEPLHPKIPQVIEQLASSVFAEIDKRSRASRKPWTIMVVGFPEQTQQETELGERLADDFSGALSEHQGVAKLLDRACLKQGYASEAITSSIYADINYQDWRSGKCGATHRIDGFTVIRGDQVQLTLVLVDQVNEEGLFEANVSWPAESGLKALLTQPLLFSESDGTSPKMFSFTRGKGRPPVCKHCKEPERTRAASKNHYTGSITFRATITADGHIEDLFVVKPAPYGMTEKAFEAVQTWTFTPALDNDGKPIAVRIPIEIVTRYGTP